MQYVSAHTDQCFKDALKFNSTGELHNLIAKIEKKSNFEIIGEI